METATAPSLTRRAQSRAETRRDITLARLTDARHQGDPANVFQQRVAAVLDAQAHGSPFALRQALVELAACSERWAAILPVPRVNAYPG